AGARAGRGGGHWRLAALAVRGAALAAGAAWAGAGGTGSKGDAHKAAGKSEKPDPLHHVMDSSHIELFPTAGWEIDLLDNGPFRRITKFMILELIAAGLIAAIYIPLARRQQSGRHPQGAWDNAFEVLLTFVRDQIARPALTPPEDEHGHGHEAGPSEGHHGTEAAAHAPPDADRFVPFLWTMFLFILFSNL